MSRTLIALPAFARFFRLARGVRGIKEEPSAATFKTWKRRGVLPFETDPNTGLLVVTPQRMVEYWCTVLFACQGKRGRVLKKIWNLIHDAFEAARAQRLRPTLWVDLSEGRMWTSGRRGDGKIEEPVPKSIRVYDLAELEEIFSEKLRAYEKGERVRVTGKDVKRACLANC